MLDIALDRQIDPRAAAISEYSVTTFMLQWGRRHGYAFFVATSHNL